MFNELNQEFKNWHTKVHTNIQLPEKTITFVHCSENMISFEEKRQQIQHINQIQNYKLQLMLICTDIFYDIWYITHFKKISIQQFQKAGKIQPRSSW